MPDSELDAIHFTGHLLSARTTGSRNVTWSDSPVKFRTRNSQPRTSESNRLRRKASGSTSLTHGLSRAPRRVAAASIAPRTRYGSEVVTRARAPTRQDGPGSEWTGLPTA